MGNVPPAVESAISSTYYRDTLITRGKEIMRDYVRGLIVMRTKLGYFSVEFEYKEICAYVIKQYNVNNYPWFIRQVKLESPNPAIPLSTSLHGVTNSSPIQVESKEYEIDNSLVETLIEEMRNIGYLVRSGKKSILIDWTPGTRELTLK